MDVAEILFEKHWKLRTGKELDETTKHHMQYCIDAINEGIKYGRDNGPEPNLHPFNNQPINCHCKKQFKSTGPVYCDFKCEH